VVKLTVEASRPLEPSRFIRNTISNGEFEKRLSLIAGLVIEKDPSTPRALDKRKASLSGAD